MKAATDSGMNRTGVGTSPFDAKELIEGAAASPPSAAGDEGAIAVVRSAYIADAEPVGTVPPPSTLKGAAKAVLQMLKGQKMSVLLDKLGERLAFERTGSRLYEAVVVKACSGETWASGPTVEELSRIHKDELRHFDMLWQIIKDLGGDPTAQTPAADIAGVQAMGLVQTVTDPRTSLGQSLNAILVAELADNDGWTMLVELMENLGQSDIASVLRSAQRDEERHLSIVRQWVASHALAEGSRELESKA